MRTAPSESKGTALTSQLDPSSMPQKRAQGVPHPLTTWSLQTASDRRQSPPDAVYAYPGSYRRWRDYGQRATAEVEAALRRREQARWLWVRVHPEDAIDLTLYSREVP